VANCTAAGCCCRAGVVHWVKNYGRYGGLDAFIIVAWSSERVWVGDFVVILKFQEKDMILLGFAGNTFLFVFH